MAATTRAGHFTSAGQTAAEFRVITEHQCGRRAGVLRTGTVATDSLAVTQNGTPNMSVNVADGACVIQGTEASTQGFYLAEAPSTTNVSIASSDPTNPRLDLIVARIKDQDYASGSPSTNTFTIEGVTGTPAGSPAVPTVPDNCVVLAVVAVAALATTITNGNITDYRWTGYGVGFTNQDNGSACLMGGIPVGLSTARPAVGLHEGMPFFETDTNFLNHYSGSLWGGTGIDVTAFTPGNSNLATSTNTGWYKRSGGQVVARYQLVLSAAPTGDVLIGMPVAVTTAAFLNTLNWGIFNGRIGSTNYLGYAKIEASGNQFSILETAHDGAADQKWNAANPGAWLTTHTIDGVLTYFV